MRRVVGAAGAIAAAMLCALSCLEPTEVTVEIKTDICDLQEVKILKNGELVASTKPAKPCEKIGTLVFVPSKMGNRFVVEVQGVTSMAMQNVVVARRAVTFQTHASYLLPIQLSRACIGVVCKTDESCNPATGMCEPIPSTCPHPPCEEPDASPDTGLDAPSDVDMRDGDDGDADAGPMCVTGFGSNFSFGTLLHSWSFDEGASPIVDGVTKTSTAVPGFVFKSSPIQGCGYTASFQGMSNIQTQLKAGIGITASMLVQIPQANSFPPILTGESQGGITWDLELVDTGQSASPQLSVTVGPTTSVTSKLLIPYDNKPHLLEVSASAMTVAFAVDGSMVDVQTFSSSTVPDSLSIVFGVGSKIAIDELKIYKGATW